MRNIILVALGGSIGALLRYGLAMVFFQLLGNTIAFPALLVNIIGSAVIGFLVGSNLLDGSLTETAKSFLVIGILGSFTTYSAMMLDMHKITQENSFFIAGIYIFATFAISFGAFYLALVISKT